MLKEYAKEKINDLITDVPKGIKTEDALYALIAEANKSIYTLQKNKIQIMINDANLKTDTDIALGGMICD